MKNGDVLRAYETLVKIANDPSLKFNIKVNYLFAKNKEKLRPEAMLIRRTRQDLLLEYGYLNEDKDIVIAQDKVEEVNQKINELMEMENSLILDEIPLEWLEEYDLGLDDVESLMPMFPDVKWIQTDNSIKN